jgi:hypothetical protein
MSGSATSRDHRREAHRRAVNLVYRILRAPPQRASGDVCFLLTFDYMDVCHPSIRKGKPGHVVVGGPIDGWPVVRELSGQMILNGLDDWSPARLIRRFDQPPRESAVL